MTRDIIQLKNTIKERLNYLGDSFECQDYIEAYHHADYVKQALDDLCHMEDSMIKKIMNKTV